MQLLLRSSRAFTRTSVATALALACLLSTSPATFGQEAKPDDPAAEKPAAAPPAPAEPAPAKPAPAAAPAAAASTEPAGESMFMWIYNAEGVFFFPQLAISVIVLWFIVQYSIVMRSSSFIPRPFLDQFEAQFRDKKFQEAYELAKKEQSFLGKMVAAAIGRLSAGQQQAIEAAQEAADDESMKHEHRLSYLAMIANVATLVGLLGTVWGMVASFMVISKSDTAPKPSELATGVSQALCTTVAGLLQAIPATVAFTFLKNRSARLTFEAGMMCEQIIGRFAALSKRPAGAAAPPSQTPTS
jgi:biopolymer transport protein ExbB